MTADNQAPWWQVGLLTPDTDDMQRTIDSLSERDALRVISRLDQAWADFMHQHRDIACALIAAQLLTDADREPDPQASAALTRLATLFALSWAWHLSSQIPDYPPDDDAA